MEKDDDDWLAVKASIFHEPENSACKLRPNFHVSWNASLHRFCLTFNEHSRVKSDTRQRCSFATTFSVEQLALLYKELTLICPQLTLANKDEAEKCWDAQASVRRFYANFSDLPKISWSEQLLKMFMAEPVCFKIWL